MKIIVTTLAQLLSGVLTILAGSILVTVALLDASRDGTERAGQTVALVTQGVAWPDCGDQAPPCATTDDGPAGNVWYVITPEGTHVTMPTPTRGHAAPDGVQWWTWEVGTVH
jgi:hypothetical protein